MFAKKGSKILKLPPFRNCFTLAMTDKLVFIMNSLKVPKIKKILLYEMKFLVPNYSCLQNPWLGRQPPPDPCSLCPLSSTEFVEPPPPPTNFLGTALSHDTQSVRRHLNPGSPNPKQKCVIRFVVVCVRKDTRPCGTSWRGESLTLVALLWRWIDQSQGYNVAEQVLRPWPTPHDTGS